MKYLGVEYDSNFPVDLFERLLNEVGTLYFIENPEKSFGVTAANLTKKKEVKAGKRRGRKPNKEKMAPQDASQATAVPPAGTLDNDVRHLSRPQMQKSSEITSKTS